jgi:hypothetical protein
MTSNTRKFFVNSIIDGGSDEPDNNTVADTVTDIGSELDPKEATSVNSIVDDNMVTDDLPSTNNIVSSYVNTTTIKKGTMLYHASYTKSTFNPIKIDLSNDDDNEKTLCAFFCTDIKHASVQIGDCSNFGMDDKKIGYIHTFRVKEDINNVYLFSQYDIREWKNTIIESKYCNGNNDDKNRYNGVGFYILKDKTSKNKISSENQIISAMYALCNPRGSLEYVHTKRCIANSEYSDNYRFDGKVR